MVYVYPLVRKRQLPSFDLGLARLVGRFIGAGLAPVLERATTRVAPTIFISTVKGIQSMPLTLVAHADWGTHPKKRWMAQAVLRPDSHYTACAPELVGEPGILVERLVAQAGPRGCVLLGFDFPIGLPARYAERTRIRDFLTMLPQLGHGDWSEFYAVADRPNHISLRRPFYPQSSRQKGEARLNHLLDGLGLEMSDLRRRCEQARPGRRAASPLFWTVGGQQVGKAAIGGWKDVLAPALCSELDVAVWPFSGSLFKLFRPGRIVIAETYPAEFYTHLGVRFSASRRGEKSGKRAQPDRAGNAPVLLAWARTAHVRLAPALRAELQDGFGPSADGEDRFDATVGLLGMLNVVLGHRPPGDPDDEAVHRIEGWILGQAEW